MQLSSQGMYIALGQIRRGPQHLLFVPTGGHFFTSSNSTLNFLFLPFSDNISQESQEDQFKINTYFANSKA